MADRLPIEHYIEECFIKCSQVVLGARIFQPDQSRPAPDKRSARWFLLEVEELAGLAARLEPWRRDVFTPLVIEVYIQPWDTSAVMPGAAPAGRLGSNDSGGARGTLLERWSLSYRPLQPGSSGYCSRAATDVAAVYKRLILLIRSLYSYVRVLPAYRMYRASKRHGADLFQTRYTLGTAPQQQQQQQHLAAPSSSGGRMCQFTFSPVETATGQFGVAVEYQPATMVHFLEQTAVLPCTPRIISDYVGSNAEGPYARSAPNAGGRSLAAPAAAAAAYGQQGGDAGAPSFLPSPQQHAPLVRHSWSSRDTSAPRVVQRGFNPVARSNSLNASSSSSSMPASSCATSAADGEQQQQLQQQQQGGQLLLVAARPSSFTDPAA
ncbi:autophagy-related protein 13-domain-containing protein [Scenedesmus sp. NREL 46B-D3]|nr:autophagy-related protein 13-domain-containing protein [Scenedesmus sp. NREL 46B-D3]